MILATEEGKHQHLIAQSKNGSGKTGAFALGSILRIDEKDKRTQVIVFSHTREMVIQICAVYKQMTENTQICINNQLDSGNFDKG